ncbi:MAG: type 4a pilus biogenesis protein PilO [Planctomycetaceae bacterium]|nr:type 4a pilus biogenesis protein PilO [Planctomycetaceae bacterium]
MGKNRFTKVFILLGVIIVAFTVYLYMLVSEAGDMWPAYRKPGTLAQQLDALDNEVTGLRVQVAQIPGRQEILEKLKVEYEYGARILPCESTPDQLIAAIRTKAQQSGITPNRLQPSVASGQAGQGANFEVWRFSLNLLGDYDQIATFINRMEEFDSPDAERTGSEKRFFEVREISIKAQDQGLANLGSGSGGAPVQHACNLIMQTYRFIGQ